MFFQADAGEFRRLLPGIEMKPMARGERTLLTEFRLAKGTIVPLHQHPQEQTGYLVKGHLRFEVDGQVIHARGGDSWSLPANIPHSADVLEDSIAIEVFSPVREEYL